MRQMAAKKKQDRTKCVMVRLTPQEYKKMAKVADELAIPVAIWVRMVALERVRELTD